MTDAQSYGLQGVDAQQLLATFWPRVMSEIRTMNVNEFKVQELPLARIKKIMKQDEEVKMISAEAPVLFAKAAQIFVSELSLRAWIHTEDNKRRTLQRNDIAMAISKYDQFDFLIDIVPRDELKTTKRPEESIRQAAGLIGPEQVQYYFQLAQMQQPGQPQVIQIQGGEQGGQAVAVQPQQQQVVQIQSPQQQQQQQQAQQQQQNQQQLQAVSSQNPAEMQSYAIQFAPGSQMQYIRVPQMVQQGTNAVAHLQAQVQQVAQQQQQARAQGAVAQESQTQSAAEQNYAQQIYQLASAAAGNANPGAIYITTQDLQQQAQQQQANEQATADTDPNGSA